LGVVAKTAVNRSPLEAVEISCYYTMMNRAAVIEQLKATQNTIARLLAS
jgi:hypothetical protein